MFSGKAINKSCERSTVVGNTGNAARGVKFEVKCGVVFYFPVLFVMV